MNISTSIWERESFFAPSDIIIIGSGLLGLWTALELISRKPALKITILERGMIPMGASTRNAGFACFGSPSEMLSDANKMGEKTMWDIVDMRYRGLKKISQHFTNLDIGFDNSGGYECYQTSNINLNEIKDKVVWLNEGMQKITGRSNLFSWCDLKMNEFGLSGFDAMIGNEMEGGLHSGKLVQGLIRKVQAAGVNILNGMQVDNWEVNNGTVLVSGNHQTLKAEQLILCTNGFTSQIQSDIFIAPARGQVFVTGPIEGLQLKGTFHYDEGYYYFRNLGDRLLIGGARKKDIETEHSTEMDLNNTIQKELEIFTARHILANKKFTISDRWSGIMGFSENKLPVIQQIQTGVFAAVCCNGMGVALSPIIADKICNMVL